MPEGVEVALTALYLNSKFKNAKITKFRVLSGRYSRTAIPGRGYLKLPATIKEINSKGKFMYMILKHKNTPIYIMNTFGLTGEWGLTKQKHSRIKMTISKGDRTYKLYYSDPRNFGTIKIEKNKSVLLDKLRSLGMDLLKDKYTSADIYNNIRRYIHKKSGAMSKPRADRQIVKVLMDQSVKSGIGSGIGSYLAIEILYHAKISPHKKMKRIYQDRRLATRLAKSIKYIIKLSYMTADVGYLEHLSDDMDAWVRKLRKRIKKNKKHRYHFHSDVDLGSDTFEFEVYRQTEDPKGNPVKAGKIVPGRTTYWVPKIQK